jgi:hypothetical protein
MKKGLCRVQPGTGPSSSTLTRILGKVFIDMAKNIIRPVKGTVDFYPDEMAFRNWLYATLRSVSESFGYQEYEAPLLETREL